MDERRGCVQELRPGRRVASSRARERGAPPGPAPPMWICAAAWVGAVPAMREGRRVEIGMERGEARRVSGRRRRLSEGAECCEAQTLTPLLLYKPGNGLRAGPDGPGLFPWRAFNVARCGKSIFRSGHLKMPAAENRYFPWRAS